MDCSLPGFPDHHQLLELTQTHVHWVGDAIQPSHPLSSPSPPAFNLPQHQGHFQWVSSLHQVVQVLESFSFSISSSNEYSGLIPLRIDWFDLLAVEGTQEAGANCKPLQNLGSVCWSTLIKVTLQLPRGRKEPDRGLTWGWMSPRKHIGKKVEEKPPKMVRAGLWTNLRPG